MKTLYESLLDDEDEVIMREAQDPFIRHFLEKYFLPTEFFKWQVGTNEWINVDTKVSYNIVDNNPLTIDVTIDSKWSTKFSIQPKYRDTITKFPNDVKIRRIHGDLDMKDCVKLKTLEGFPEYVTGVLNLEGNKSLKTLKGCPQEIKKLNLVSCLKLESLDGCPKTLDIFHGEKCNKLTDLSGTLENVRRFACHNCLKLTSLNGCPKNIAEVLWISDSPNLKSFYGLPQNLKDVHIQNCINLTSTEGINKSTSIEYLDISLSRAKDKKKNENYVTKQDILSTGAHIGWLVDYVRSR